MFLHLFVPRHSSGCPLNLARKSDPKKMFEDTRYCFGARCRLICANYALHQVAKDNTVKERGLAGIVKRNFLPRRFPGNQEKLKATRKFYDSWAKDVDRS